MVFSLLTFIAELKSNVIFAMEEPEIAIPPHTQRRIVQFLQAEMNQSILTTHSPFVLEQYDPANPSLTRAMVRRLFSGGCESRPTTEAPVGSSQGGLRR